MVMAVSPSAAARFRLSASLVRNSSSGVGGSRRLYLPPSEIEFWTLRARSH